MSPKHRLAVASSGSLVLEMWSAVSLHAPGPLAEHFGMLIIVHLAVCRSVPRAKGFTNKVSSLLVPTVPLPFMDLNTNKTDVS